jgi:hypothetical protein
LKKTYTREFFKDGKLHLIVFEKLTLFFSKRIWAFLESALYQIENIILLLPVYPLFFGNSGKRARVITEPVLALSCLYI